MDIKRIMDVPCVIFYKSYMHWIIHFGGGVKDKEGHPSFALVNKATGQAMKHSVGATYQVQLTTYDPHIRDESVLWTMSGSGDGYTRVRMANNIKLHVDAFSDINHGGVHEGTKIVLWEQKTDSSNQRWKMVDYCKFTNTNFTY
ncbi:hydroxyproline-rich glycoprotein family protein [Artemisia annua]|uniref:Hydroxyproline-rich glycoprotein family protein n=1 Tax=Artemisia annua TaxID=35608 RepID=A0A2U1KVK5_ARTAN|nr:hydroxyproline-rich glycoprotein family protein [Artemisia annua]